LEDNLCKLLRSLRLGMEPSDAFELIEKIVACGKINADIIAEIESHAEDEEIVTSMDCNVAISFPDFGTPKYKFKTSVFTKSIRKLIAEWEYSGKTLNSPKNVFNHVLKSDISKFLDVKVANIQLLEIVQLYNLLKEPNLFREELRLFLENMECLQVALGDIQSHMIHVKPSELNLSEDSEAFQMISKGLQQLCLDSHPSSEIIFSTKIFSGVDSEKNALRDFKKFGIFSIGIEELALSYSGISKIPRDIGAFTNLKILWLSNNSLSTLPDSLYSLSNLETLDLGNNQLLHLSEKLGNLKNLEKLDLKSNKLTCLPESIGLLENLTFLDVSGNKLTRIPETINMLVNLEILELCYNKLSSLPESFGNLTNLQRLELDGNEFISTPEVLNRLANLEHLELQGQKSGAKLTKPHALGESCSVIL